MQIEIWQAIQHPLENHKFPLWTQTIPWGKHVMWELVRWPAVLLGKYSDHSGSGWHTLFFLSWFPKNSTNKCKCQKRSTNDVSWIHTRTSNNQQLQVKLTSSCPSWLSWSWGFAERSVSVTTHANLSSSILQTSHLWRHILFFSTCCGETKTSHRIWAIQKIPGSIHMTFLLFIRFCFITLILDSYMTHHFSKKKSHNHWKMLGLTLIYIYIMIKSSSPKPKTHQNTHVFMDDSTEFLRWKWQIIDTRTALEVNQTSTNPGNQLLLGGKLLGGK